MRLNIDRDLVKQLTGQRTAFEKNTSRRWIDVWARDIVMWYWPVAILFWQLSIDHFVNVQYTRCALAKTRLRHPSLPFDSLPYPTLTICRRVRTYARSITWQPNEKRLTIFYEYGALSHARFAPPSDFSTILNWLIIPLNFTQQYDMCATSDKNTNFNISENLLCKVGTSNSLCRRTV